ncbi:hypothetical protein RZN22_13850 [Bacillaceae bacterium S4-13-58]
MKHLIILLMTIPLILLLLVSCNQEKRDTQGEETISMYEKFVNQSMNSALNGSIKKVKITYSKSTEYGIISHVITSMESDKSYESILLIKENKNVFEIVDDAHNIIDKTTPFTHLEMTGVIKDGAYHIVSGVINDKNIDKVEISFLNGLLIETHKSNENTYEYVNINNTNDSGIQSIKALSSSGDIVYQY